MPLHQRFNWAAGIAAICLLTGGCGGEPEVEEEPVTFIDEGAETMIPVMLNNQTVRADGFTRRLRVTDVTDVNVLEVTKRDEQGFKTAHVTFKVDGYLIEAKVTYRKDIKKNKQDLDVVTYPVSKVETLSAKPSDAD